MKRLLLIYVINAFSFGFNFFAIFVYIKFAGYNGYGSYGLYILFMSILFLSELNVIKVSTLISKFNTNANNSNNLFYGDQFIKNYGILLILACVPISFIAGLSLPINEVTGVGGAFVAIVVFAESIFTIPVTRINYRMILRNDPLGIYVIRLVSTISRHAICWTVLVLTGSIKLTIAAVVVRAVIMGAGAQYFLSIEKPAGLNSGIKAETSPWFIFANFIGAGFLILAMQEIPAFYIVHQYGQANLGQYRSIYDIVGQISFIATIYPTVLFPFIVKYSPIEPHFQTRMKFLAKISIALVAFHVGFGMVATGCLASPALCGRYVNESWPYVSGLVGGVSILGYNRFLLETTLATGKQSVSLLAIAAAICVTIFFLGFYGSNAHQAEIGVAWLAGQSSLLFFLEVILVKRAVLSAKHTGLLTAVLVLPLVSAALLWSFEPWLTVVIFCGVIAIGSLISSVIMYLNIRSNFWKIRQT